MKQKPKPWSANYARLRLRLMLGLLVTAVLVTGLVSWQIYSSYVAKKEGARRQTETFVHAIEAHVARSMELVDLSLIGFSNTIGALSPATRNSGADIQQLLLSQGGALSANFWILYIDAAGRGVASTRNFHVSGVDYSDRDYFQAHTIVDYGRFVGGPIVGKASGDRLFTVSRRVQSPAGEFLGVVTALMSAKDFANFFESARFDRDVSITLLHRGGKVIARAPMFAQSFGTDLSGADLFRRLQQASSGTYQTKSQVDHGTRIYSYRAISHLPLVVSVGISSRAWDRSLNQHMMLGGATILLIVGGLLLSARRMLSSYARLERSETGYRALYAEVQSAEQKLSVSEKRLRTIADNMPAMITYVDRDQVLRFYNRTFMLWRDVPNLESINRPLAEVIGAKWDVEWQANIERGLAGEHVSFEFEAVVLGQQRHLHTTYVPELAEDGSVAGIYTLTTDISSLKEKEKALEALTRFDPLTGLANRRELDTRLNEAILRCRRSGEPMAVMFLDIDFFKSINDQYGHAAGDEVLKQSANRLLASVRATDTVSRLAGDEFVVVLEKLDTPADAETVAAKIIAALRQPILFGGTDIMVTTSIGICFLTGNQAPAAELLALADKALYDAKAAGRNTYAMEKC